MSGSGSDTEDDFVSCPFPRISAAEQAARVTSVVLVMVVSLLGNILVIHVMRRRRWRLGSQARLWPVTCYLLSHLACADLLITAFNMAELLQRQVSGTDRVFAGTAGQLYCRGMLFVQTLSMCCSVLTLTAIAVERYCSIVFPLKRIVTLAVARRLMAAVWLLSCLVSCPLLYAMRALDYHGEYYCAEDWTPLDSIQASQVYYGLFFGLAFLCPLLVISLLYARIVRKLRRQTVSGNSGVGHARRHALMVRRVVRMLVAVVIGFAACWLPQHVSMFIHYFALHVCPPEALWFGGELLGYANSALNPCIYIAFHAEFRLELRRLARKACWLCVRAGDLTNQSTPSRLNSPSGITRTMKLTGSSRSTLPSSPVVMTRFRSDRLSS